MAKGQKNLIAVIVSVLLAIGFVYYQLRSLDFNHIQIILQDAQYFYIIPSIAMGMAALYIRGLRWKILLEPLGYHPSTLNTTAATTITYFANIIIPRSGEVFRCTSLYAAEGIPVNKSLGTVIVERVIDLFCLGILLLLTAIFNFDFFKAFILDALEARNNSPAKENNLLLYLGIGLLFVLALIFFTQTLWKKSLLYNKAKTFLIGIKEGLMSVRRLKKWPLFLLYTLLIWVLYFYMTYIIVFTLKDAADLGHAAGLFILFAGALGMIVPASGGIGSYHAAQQIAFEMLGKSEELGYAFALLVHSPHTIMAIVLGFISILVIYLNTRKRKKHGSHSI